jgi:ring-1,2-phenylacetyl-CoA epoxidase subunit PaaD
MVSARRPASTASRQGAGDPAGVLTLAREIAESAPDPELPMLTLADLGILRDVSADGDRVIVSLTPTYSGCPALAEMRRDLTLRLAAAGLDAQVRTVLSPAWSSDWITAAGRRKLAAAGIAPPLPARSQQARAGGGPVPLALTPVRRDVACPLCGAPGAGETAAFGATACKALYRCAACGEPFEYLKEI